MPNNLNVAESNSADGVPRLKTLNLQIQDKLRAAHVDRWHIVNTARRQSLAEHSYNVAMIAMDLCNRLGKEEWRERVAVMALHHDLEEVVTGDIPSSAKPPKMWEPGPWTPEKIVKVADLIDAHVFIQEYRVGNQGGCAMRFVHDQYSTMLNSLNDWARCIVSEMVYQIMFGDMYEERRTRVLEGAEVGSKIDGVRESG